MTAASGPVRILVVDDEPDFIEEVRFWLTARGYHVESATSGVEAMERINTNPPMLVFLDLKMPGVDGVNTLRDIRRDHPQLPVVVVTVSADDPRQFGPAQELGVVGVFSKDGSFDRLTDLVEAALHPQSGSSDASSARPSSWRAWLMSLLHR